MNGENPGEGGSYLLDPETGERTLVKRTSPQTSLEGTADGTSEQETSNSSGTGKQLRNRSNSNGSRRNPSKGFVDNSSSE